MPNDAQEKKTVNLDEIELAPPGTSALTDDQVARIKAFKAVLGELDPVSLEETLKNFSRDVFPEREIHIYERVANTLTKLMENRDDSQRSGVYAIVMACTFVGLNAEAVKDFCQTLDPEFVEKIVTEIKAFGRVEPGRDPMTKPSLGRIVLVGVRGAIEPAIVTAVHDDTCINARVLGDEGPPELRTSLIFADFEYLTERGGWCWPPRV